MLKIRTMQQEKIPRYAKGRKAGEICTVLGYPLYAKKPLDDETWYYMEDSRSGLRLWFDIRNFLAIDADEEAEILSFARKHCPERLDEKRIVAGA